MLKTVDGRWGKITYLAKDEYVGRSIHNYGEYNPDETEMVLQLAQKDKLSLDIGANMGCITQALLYSGFDTWSFEPQPEVYKVLTTNCNNQCFNFALGAQETTAQMPKVYYSEKNNFGGISLNTRSILGSYTVPVKRLDDLLQDNDTPVGFIKLDVEGYELSVLLGAKETIEKYKPILYVEDDRVEKSASLRKFITALGYTIEEHKPPLYRPQNFFGLQKNIWNQNFASHNLICKPC
jgi:FkbM family methyltransferase